MVIFQLLSHVWHFSTPCRGAWSTPGSSVLHCLPELLKFMSMESVMPSNHFILCHPLLLLPSVFPRVRVFSSESALHIGWPKYWGFIFSICPSSEYSGLISFRIDWCDLLTVQGTLESSWAPQFKNISSLALNLLYGSTYPSYPYMTTGRTIALTGWTSVGTVMSLLFNMLSRFVIAYIICIYLNICT